MRMHWFALPILALSARESLDTSDEQTMLQVMDRRVRKGMGDMDPGMGKSKGKSMGKSMGKMGMGKTPRTDMGGLGSNVVGSCLTSDAADWQELYDLGTPMSDEQEAPTFNNLAALWRILTSMR